MMKKILFIALLLTLFACNKQENKNMEWSLVLVQPGGKETELTKLPSDLSKEFSYTGNVDNIRIAFNLEPKKSYTIFKATATANGQTQECYFSLKCSYASQKPYFFNGEVPKSDVYRQSPHDPNAWMVNEITQQGVPMVALKDSNSFCVAVCSSPAFYNNFTIQEFNLENKTISLNSGDNGKGTKPDTTKKEKIDYNGEKTQVFAPGIVKEYYQAVSAEKPHVFEGILFNCNAKDVNGLRRKVNGFVADHFSNGKYTDSFGSLAFATAYMNLRVNDSHKSDYWVIPAIEYSNTQYCRDAFWISTMLSPVMEAQCLKNELDVVNHYAEYPLFVVIWAYRAKMKGLEVDMQKVQKYVDAIEKHVKNGYFYSYDENDGRQDFQGWGDLVAFEKNDVLTYNQGLYAMQLICSEKMGLTTTTKSDAAIKNYRDMFLKDKGYFPISKLKSNILSPDPLVGDLLSQILLNKTLLEKSQVQQHFDRIIKYAKTQYGYKIYCLPDGRYLPIEAFDAGRYISQMHKGNTPEGQYQHGGSWTLYDMLFLLDSYLYGIEGAKQELVWRSSLDFKLGGTTFEYINTKTGEPAKPNMGWNISIYSFVRKLVDEGKLDKEVFETIDRICMEN